VRRLRLAVMTSTSHSAVSATTRELEIKCIKNGIKMKINVKELKVGDVFMTQDTNKTFKVAEDSETPVYTLNFEKIYPIFCSCFSAEHGKNLGYMKLSDEITEVELIYRDNDTKYESWTSAVFKREEEDGTF
jgi:hypothetical protein